MTTATSAGRQPPGRLAAVVACPIIIGVALVLRAVTTDPFRNIAGTALYAALVFALVVVAMSDRRPVRAGAIASGICWAIELAQLSPVPAALATRSTLARLTLGSTFVPEDLLWYPLGVLPLVALLVARDRAARSD